MKAKINRAALVETIIPCVAWSSDRAITAGEIADRLIADLDKGGVTVDLTTDGPAIEGTAFLRDAAYQAVVAAAGVRLSTTAPIFAAFDEPYARR